MKATLFFTVLVLSIPSWAQVNQNSNSEEAPPLPIASFDGSLNATCEIVEKLRDEENRTDYTNNFGESPVYMTYTPDMEAYVLNVADFSRNYIELLEVRNHITAKNFKKRITEKALRKALERKQDYYSVMKTRRGTKAHNSEQKLNLCLSKKNYSSILELNKTAAASSFNEENLRSFLAETLENSIRAWLILEQKTLLKNKKEEDLAIAEDEKESLSEEEQLKFDADIKIEQKYKALIGDLDTQLNILYSESGPILKAENDMKISQLKVFNHVLRPSMYMMHILRLFSSNELRQIKEQVGNNINKQNVVSALLNVANIKRIEDYFLRNEATTTQLHKKLLRAVSDHIEEINEAAIDVCEQEGAELHHFDEFVRNVLDEHLTSPYAANLLYKDVGAYCYLKEIEPPKNSDFLNWRNLTGTGLLLVGSGLKWIAKMSFWGGIGNGMMWAGEGLLGYEAYRNYMIYSYKKGNSYLMANGGWISYLNHTKNLDEAEYYFWEMTASPVLVGFSLWPGAAMANTAAPHIQSWVNKERVTKKTLAISTSKIGASKYFQRLLKNDDYLAYRDGIKLRYDYYQNNPDFQKQLNEMILLKEKYKAGYETPFGEVNLLFRKFDLSNLKKPNGISALHRNSEHGRDAIITIDRFNGPKPDPENVDAFREWKKNNHKVQSWINYFDNPKSSPMDKVFAVVDRGATADAQIPYLKKYIQQNDARSFLDPDQPGQTLIRKFELPRVKDGVVSDELYVKEFDSYSDLKAYYEEMRTIAEKTFANSPARELSRDSDIYRALDNWAWEYRRLQFLHSELRLNTARNEVQEEIFQRASRILSEPSMRPRGDARANLLRQEIRAERIDLFRSARSKSKVFNDEFSKLSNEAQKRIKETSFIGDHLTKLWVLPATILTERTYRAFQAQGKSAQIQAKFNYWLRNTIRGGKFEYNMDEIMCAAEARSFSFMLCYNAQAKEEVAYELAQAVDRPISYILANDKELKNKLRNYAYKMIYLRRKFRGSELFHLSDYILNTAYSDFAKTEFARLIDLKNPDKPELSTRILEILSSKTKEEAQNALAKFDSDYGGLYLESIQAFIDSPQSMTSAIKEGLRLPRRIENDLRGIVFIEGYNQTGALGEEFNTYTGNLIDELGIGNFLGLKNARTIQAEKDSLDQVLEENGTSKEEVDEKKAQELEKDSQEP